MTTERHIRIFRNGRNQAVRIPREFELDAEEAIIRKEDHRLVIEPVRKTMNIAIASYAFHGLLERGMIDLFGYLESCRYRYQLDTANIWNGMLASIEDGYLEKVKKGLTSRDLTLVNLCVDGAHVWEPDPDRREQNYQNALAHLHAAEVLGARTVRIDAGGRDPVWSEEQFDWIVRRYREYAERAYINGYKVGPENHWGTELVPENIVHLAQAVSHPGFGVLLHIKEEERNVRLLILRLVMHSSFPVEDGNPRHRPLPEKVPISRGGRGPAMTIQPVRYPSRRAAPTGSALLGCRQADAGPAPAYDGRVPPFP